MMLILNFTILFVFTTVFAYTLFLIGFFPVKSTVPDRSTIANYSLEQHVISQPDRKYKRLVVFLIDALRSDFVYQHDVMSFIKDKLIGGFGYHYTVKAHPPTVTLPRLKALTSGSIPGFVDVVLNFDSASLAEDNIVTQAFTHNRKIVFYGDDTWLKLFPGHFRRSEGTTSFFVTDYTEVDDNVTRHLDTELSAPDWDLMIVHYLGLDHIGHTAGPHSPLVPPKLMEMDNIVRKIYTSLEQEGSEFMLLICGDHGMSDQGSHGGASDREVLVPAVFLSPSFSHQGQQARVLHTNRERLQIDLAPTLSVLMGLPIPSNNLGQILTQAIPGLTHSQILDTLYINSQQIIKLMQQNVADFTQEPSYELYEDAVQLHVTYLSTQHSSTQDVSDIVYRYQAAMEAMASKIAGSLTTYDLYSMALAILILSMSLLTMKVTSSDNELQPFSSMAPVGFCVLSLILIFGHMTACTSQSFHSTTLCGRSFKSVAMQIVVFVILHFLCAVLASRYTWFSWEKKAGKSNVEMMLWTGTILHSLSFGSSSFVEEEHQTWYFLTMSVFLVIMIDKISTHLKYICVKKNDQNADQNILLNLNTSYQYNCTNSDQNVYNTRQLSQNQNTSSKSPPDMKGYEKLSEKMSRETQLKNVQIPISSLPFKSWLPWKPCAAMVTVMLLGRMMRTVNQTGNKWLDTPDLGDWLVRPDNKEVLSVLVVLSMLFMLVLAVGSSRLEYACFLAGIVACYKYRVATQTVYSITHLSSNTSQLSKGITEARSIYCMILSMNLISLLRWAYNRNKLYSANMYSKPSDQSTLIRKTVSQRANEQLHKYASKICDNNEQMQQHAKGDILNSADSIYKTTNFRDNCAVNAVETIQLSWLLLMTLLLRTHNIILVAMVMIQEQLLWRYVIKHSRMTAGVLSLMCWWMGQAAFFQQGISNSMSSVDVSAGYVGLENYQPILVGLLLFLATYAAPIFWLITLLKYIIFQHKHRIDEEDSKSACSLRSWLLASVETLLTERLMTLLLYCVIVTSQRYHLFVWTVFSPKLLYEGMLTAMVSIFATVICIVSYCL